VLDIAALRGRSTTKRMAVKLHAVSDHAPSQTEVDVLRAHVGKGMQRWPLNPQPKAETRKLEVDKQAEIVRKHRKLLRYALLSSRRPPPASTQRFQLWMGCLSVRVTAAVSCVWI
jgi:hypothetical protein